MKLIVGLGNPGLQYELTRHNMGFMAVDFLLTQWKLTIPRTNFFGNIWEYKDRNGEKVFLLKPTTYMNLSGKSVVAVKNFYHLNLNEIMVLYDDKDVQFGSIKLKPNGSGAGHNGIKDITTQLNSNQWPRIKIGIGKDPQISMVDWVLGKVPVDQREQLPKIHQRIFELLTLWITEDMSITKLMSLFNN